MVKECKSKRENSESEEKMLKSVKKIITMKGILNLLIIYWIHKMYKWYAGKAM